VAQVQAAFEQEKPGPYSAAQSRHEAPQQWSLFPTHEPFFGMKRLLHALPQLTPLQVE
jgi:hypothetical protein